MHELQRVLDACADVVARCAPTDMPYRLLAIGSAATGEVTLTDSDGSISWRSDVELYMESPDVRLARTLERASSELKRIDGPSVEISGASPERISRFLPCQWMVDIGNTARRIGGTADGWPEPFARFAGIQPHALDAVILLANRSADQLDPCRDGDYSAAKFALDAYSAALILTRRYRTGVGARLLLLSEPVVRQSCLAVGLDPFVLDALPIAASWKLSGQDRHHDKFRRIAEETTSALRRCVPLLLDSATGLPRFGGIPSLRRWIGERPLVEMLRDWSRGMASDFAGTLHLGANWKIGPLWAARIGALEAFTSSGSLEEAAFAYKSWTRFAKGV